MYIHMYIIYVYIYLNIVKSAIEKNLAYFPCLASLYIASSFYVFVYFLLISCLIILFEYLRNV